MFCLMLEKGSWGVCALRFYHARHLKASALFSLSRSRQPTACPATLPPPPNKADRSEDQRAKPMSSGVCHSWEQHRNAGREPESPLLCPSLPTSQEPARPPVFLYVPTLSSSLLHRPGSSPQLSLGLLQRVADSPVHVCLPHGQPFS